MLKDVVQSLRSEIKHEEHLKHRADFQKESIQRRLACMTEDELALWQDDYPPNSPQYILVQHEWNRRLTAEQVKASRFSAIIALIAALLGSALTIAIQWLAK